jgi:hypothetical protein
MSNSAEPVASLGEFTDRIAAVRREFGELWELPEHKELWFRGESRDYGDTILRPELYRPAKGVPLKPISRLLAIENDLYEEFQRIAVELAHEKTTDEEWDWDSYFLMQHHGAPTRLLDWSDGSLMALHFAVRNKSDDSYDALVYVLAPDALATRLKQSSDIKKHRRGWKDYVKRHPSYELEPDCWEDGYLPGDKVDLAELRLPQLPVVLDLPRFSRRIAAQRSRFIAFGADPHWLANEFKQSNSTIRRIIVAAAARPKIRQELRDCGSPSRLSIQIWMALDVRSDKIWEDRRATVEENTL